MLADFGHCKMCFFSEAALPTSELSLVGHEPAGLAPEEMLRNSSSPLCYLVMQSQDLMACLLCNLS